jgi:formate dehydrogenase subunit delta
MAGDNSKTLVRMANQIAAFFKPYGEDAGVSGVQNHLKKFWSPAMRRDLGAYIDHGGEGLESAVVKAYQRMADEAANPAQRAQPDPHEQGEMASDAG